MLLSCSVRDVAALAFTLDAVLRALLLAVEGKQGVWDCKGCCGLLSFSLGDFAVEFTLAVVLRALVLVGEGKQAVGSSMAMCTMMGEGGGGGGCVSGRAQAEPGSWRPAPCNIMHAEAA